MAYNINIGNHIICPRTFYALYIGPNNNGNGPLIFKLSMKQILVTMKYYLIRVPGNLIKAINETYLFNNKIQTNHFYSDNFLVRNDHSYNYEDDSWIHFNNENNSEDEGYDKSDNSQ